MLAPLLEGHRASSGARWKTAAAAEVVVAAAAAEVVAVAAAEAVAAWRHQLSLCVVSVIDARDMLAVECTLWLLSRSVLLVRTADVQVTRTESFEA